MDAVDRQPANINSDVDAYTKIVNEEELIDQLGLLNERINHSIKIIWNYWWGKKARDYIDWKNLKKAIDTTSLTDEGRLRLTARHESIGKRIVPSFMKMAVQLWPLAALWVIQKLGTTVITKTVTDAMEARRVSKQIRSIDTKLKTGMEKLQPLTSLKKTSPRRGANY